MRNLSLADPALLTAAAGYAPTDAAAITYIAAVEAADGQALEPATRRAIDQFIIGCKADGIWNAIKASCILAGARTLTGALVPLVGTAPASAGFVSGDYNRKTGLVGNGTASKYINSNRNNNADPQNNNHNATYATNIGTTGVFMGANDGTTGAGAGANVINRTGFTRSRSANIYASPATYTGGFIGMSRSSSVSYIARCGGTNGTITQASDSPINTNILVFMRTGPASFSPTDARLAFYSIGESLDLALLDARVTTLINALAAAIL